jgi:transcription initiation factor TFIIB
VIAVVCPECGGRISHGSDGLACTECGLVIEDSPVSLSQDWCAYNWEELHRRARTGPPETLLYNDKGHLTDVGEYTTDILFSRDLSSAQRARAKKLHRLQRRVKARVDRPLTDALQELQRISSQLELPQNARELAARYVRAALRAKIHKGRSITLVAAASVLLALRVLSMNRQHAEVAEASGTDLKMLMRTYRVLKRETGTRVAVIKPEQLLSKVCSQAEASPEIEQIARMILLRLREKGHVFSGANPYSIAGAAVYYAAMLLGNSHISQNVAAKAAGVVEVTVRHWYKRIVEALTQEDIQKLFADMGPVFPRVDGVGSGKGNRTASEQMTVPGSLFL